MELTPNEATSLDRTAARLIDLHAYLHTHPVPRIAESPQLWFAYLVAVKDILGNFSNDLSLVSCLMAKQYLTSRLSLLPFDVALKPQGANGLDIDERTTAGERVIGEIKTTTPYHGTKFGANQIKSLRADFAKLQVHEAAYKYMFVTDTRAFEALCAGYTTQLPGVTIVCLASGDELIIPPISEDMQ